MHNWVDIVFAELKDSERYFGSVFHNSHNTGPKSLRYAIQCVQHCESKSRIQDCKAKLINAVRSLQNIGLLPTVESVLSNSKERLDRN